MAVSIGSGASADPKSVPDQLADIQSQVVALNGVVASQGLEIDALEAENATQGAQILTLDSDIDTLEADVDTLEATVAALGESSASQAALADLAALVASGPSQADVEAVAADLLEAYKLIGVPEDDRALAIEYGGLWTRQLDHEKTAGEFQKSVGAHVVALGEQVDAVCDFLEATVLGFYCD